MNTKIVSKEEIVITMSYEEILKDMTTIKKAYESTHSSDNNDLFYLLSRYQRIEGDARRQLDDE